MLDAGASSRERIRSTPDPTAAFRRALVVVVPSIAILLASVFAYQSASRSSAKLLHARFDAEAVLASRVIIQTLETYREVVASIRSLQDASNEVDRRAFAAFVGRSLDTYPGIQALEWVPRVAASDRVRAEARAQAEGQQDFQFRRWTSDGEWLATDGHWADEYFPVYFVEPVAGNEAAIGIDLASNPPHWAALEKARDTGQPVATTAMSLAQQPGGDPASCW